MLVYFDNAATTRPFDSVIDKMGAVMRDTIGNPASMSTLGIEAEKQIIQAKNIISQSLGSLPEEIYFTSGGTEADNWAIFGTAAGYNRSGKHIVTTAVEHPAVLAPIQRLTEKGYEATIVPVDQQCNVKLDALEQSIRPDTILVSCMWANNETGTLEDIEAIGKRIKEINPNTLFHVDGVQGYGKYKLNVQKAKIDMLSASGHKFHGPRGTGFLYIKKGLRVRPLIYGGSHQNGMRAGTENTAGTAAMSLAADICYRHLEDNKKAVFTLKKWLSEQILSEISDTIVNGETLEKASPYVLNMSFLGLRSEVLLHALEEKGIFVSAGSACSSKKKNHSTVLQAMHLSEERIEGAVRFSFSPENTLEEAAYCLAALKEFVPILRKYQRK